MGRVAMKEEMDSSYSQSMTSVLISQTHTRLSTNVREQLNVQCWLKHTHTHTHNHTHTRTNNDCIELESGDPHDDF